MPSDSEKLPGKGEPSRRRRKNGQYDSKLTDELLETLANAIRVGTSIDGAARFAGINRDTFYAWMKAARLPDASPRLLLFVKTIEDAVAQWEVDANAMIHRAGDTQWQAKAWQLERRMPDTYGRKLRVEDDRGGDPRAPALARALLKQGMDIARLTADQLETLIELFLIMRIDGDDDLGGGSRGGGTGGLPPGVPPVLPAGG